MHFLTISILHSLMLLIFNLICSQLKSLKVHFEQKFYEDFETPNFVQSLMNNTGFAFWGNAS